MRKNGKTNNNRVICDIKVDKFDVSTIQHKVGAYRFKSGCDVRFLTFFAILEGERERGKERDRARERGREMRVACTPR